MALFPQASQVGTCGLWWYWRSGFCVHLKASLWRTELSNHALQPTAFGGG